MTLENEIYIQRLEKKVEALQEKIDRYYEAVALGVKTIYALADQQAMPDDSYVESVEKMKELL